MASVRRAVKTLSRDASATPGIAMLRGDLLDAIAEIRESAE
jgi:hypothetical protein